MNAMNAVWVEALGLAKDQIRHGNIYYTELETAANQIYTNLVSLAENGPALAVTDAFALEKTVDLMGEVDIDNVIEKKSDVTAKYARHYKEKRFVRCAICGDKLQWLSVPHLRKHGLSKEEYCERFGCKPEALSTRQKAKKAEVKKIETKKPEVKKPIRGDENPLHILKDVMVEFGLNRTEVIPYLEKVGLNNITGLKQFALRHKKNYVDALKYAAHISQKAC